MPITRPAAVAVVKAHGGASKEHGPAEERLGIAAVLPAQSGPEADPWEGDKGRCWPDCVVVRAVQIVADKEAPTLAVQLRHLGELVPGVLHFHPPSVEIPGLVVEGWPALVWVEAQDLQHPEVIADHGAQHWGALETPGPWGLRLATLTAMQQQAGTEREPVGRELLTLVQREISGVVAVPVNASLCPADDSRP